jgi:hypothetical protein
LLALPDPAMVDEMVGLAWQCFDYASSWFGQPAALNPKFAGSKDIEGADADLILGDLLLEIKTVSKVRSSHYRAWLRQLLGYALLDYDDRYRIRRVGIWLTRQQQILTVPLARLLSEPFASRDLHETEVVSHLSRLRRQFRDELLRIRNTAPWLLYYDLRGSRPEVPTPTAWTLPLFG